MSEITPITGQQAIELLRRAVDEKGRDHRPVSAEGSCRYRQPVATNDDLIFPEGAEVVPVCGVGYAFHYLGVLGNWITSPGQNGLTIGGLFLDEVTPEAVAIFGAFQNVQDEGGTWGEAYDYAEAAARGRGITVKHA